MLPSVEAIQFTSIEQSNQIGRATLRVLTNGDLLAESIVPPNDVRNYNILAVVSQEISNASQTARHLRETYPALSLLYPPIEDVTRPDKFLERANLPGLARIQNFRDTFLVSEGANTFPVQLIKADLLVKQQVTNTVAAGGLPIVAGRENIFYPVHDLATHLPGWLMLPQRSLEVLQYIAKQTQALGENEADIASLIMEAITVSLDSATSLTVGNKGLELPHLNVLHHLVNFEPEDRDRAAILRYSDKGQRMRLMIRQWLDEQGFAVVERTDVPHGLGTTHVQAEEEMLKEYVPRLEKALSQPAQAA
jgi:hypothetical protein